MGELRVVDTRRLGWDFIPPEFLPEGKDENYLRDAQSSRPVDYWQPLTPEQIAELQASDNTSDDWANVLVAEGFDASRVRRCQFHGLVRIGSLSDKCLEFNELITPIGLSNSLIVSCDIGSDVAIHDVHYLAHYIIADNCILLNIDEMHTTNHAKFGNGIVTDGEDESVRVSLDLINEAGGREVLPFDGMIVGDAALWALNPGDEELTARLREITQNQFDSRRGFYGEIGENCVIKTSRIIKDVKLGPCAYVKGANKLKNLTVHSSAESPTQIGEGVELVNGIIGYGCQVFYGCKAVRFVMGDNASLKYGARLIHSVLGDNSTISCCEVLNNLVYPAHEQHHNNSFLIAALVMGQSNIGAGATIGSNHNSRAPDGEIHAGRGFWPGLCVTLKHNCKLPSFTLLAKGDYPAELNVPLPFSLVSNNVTADRLQILPAYWWLYNMYALARNNWKFNTRDKRKVKRQKIELDSLAPDTAEEMFTALEHLAVWTAQSQMHADGASTESLSDAELSATGHKLLSGPADDVGDLEILAPGVERSTRKTVVFKAHAGYAAYRQMLHHYAMTNLLNYFRENPEAKFADMCGELSGPRQSDWVNLGGQLIVAADVEAIKAGIKSGKLDSWNAIHGEYEKLWNRYPTDKKRHALATLLELLGVEELTGELWTAALERSLEIQTHICEQTYLSRKKDDDNPFRQAVYKDLAEMQAVLGTADGNSFVKQLRKETDEFEAFVTEVAQRG